MLSEQNFVTIHSLNGYELLDRIAKYLIFQCWKKISLVVHEPQNEEDYEKLSEFLNKLLDIVGVDESHQLMRLVDVSHMIFMYDDEHYQSLENGTQIKKLSERFKVSPAIFS